MFRVEAFFVVDGRRRWNLLFVIDCEYHVETLHESWADLEFKWSDFDYGKFMNVNQGTLGRVYKPLI